VLKTSQKPDKPGPAEKNYENEKKNLGNPAKAGASEKSVADFLKRV